MTSGYPLAAQTPWEMPLGNLSCVKTYCVTVADLNWLSPHLCHDSYWYCCCIHIIILYHYKQIANLHVLHITLPCKTLAWHRGSQHLWRSLPVLDLQPGSVRPDDDVLCDECSVAHADRRWTGLLVWIPRLSAWLYWSWPSLCSGCTCPWAAQDRNNRTWALSTNRPHYGRVQARPGAPDPLRENLRASRWEKWAYTCSRCTTTNLLLLYTNIIALPCCCALIRIHSVFIVFVFPFLHCVCTGRR